jgi:hypothetical protein
MKIGVTKEIEDKENRIALTPEGAKDLIEDFPHSANILERNVLWRPARRTTLRVIYLILSRLISYDCYHTGLGEVFIRKPPNGSPEDRQATIIGLITSYIVQFNYRPFTENSGIDYGGKSRQTGQLEGGHCEIRRFLQ